jgi:N-carbamoyl-L-amino-acid hydrolase
MKVREERLRAELETNASFGALPDVDHGRTVLTGTEADRGARDHLVERLRDADMTVNVDAVGNVVGRWSPESADDDLAPVAAGSHLDSVPRGGIFDGPLGVYAALEAVRAMQDAGLDPERPVEVVSFTEEEGARFGGGLLGSSVATGRRSVEEALSMTDSDGVTLREALEDVGYCGEGRLDASSWDAWLELHVEQDIELEAAGVPVGVVTTITGIAHRTVTLEGTADHAGATAMGDRRDALAGAAAVVRDVERAAQEVVATDSETAVATVGRVDATPNATNVVPGRVELGVDVRDVARDSLDHLLDRVDKSVHRVAADRDLEATIETDIDVDPRPMSERVRDAAVAAAESRGIVTMDMPSGAAHDTMFVGDVTDAGLLFAPSVDGVSHTPDEWTDWSDCATATQVLADALADLSGAQ